MGRMGELMDRSYELAWAAGFLDGEGCFTVLPSNGNYQCLVDAAQMNPEPLMKLKKLFGGNLRFANSVYGGNWYWRVYASNASEVAKAVLPYLVYKNRQAEIIIEFQETKGIQGKITSAETFALREALCQESKALKKRHPASAERTSEEAPPVQVDGAMFRSHENDNHENTVEIAVSRHFVAK